MRDISKGELRITYLAHSAFRFQTKAGEVILIDPWLDNPLFPKDMKEIGDVDIILVTHGHGDHLGNTLEMCTQKKSKVIAIYEIIHYLIRKGVKNVIGMNMGGTLREDDIRITMVPASHSSSIEDNGKLLYAGDATGFIIRFESEFTVYYAGDTAVFQDMGLIREIYRPDLALLPIGGLYVMAPLEAHSACRLIQPRFVIPMHYGTLPGLTGTPEEFRELMRVMPNTRVIVMNPDETLAEDIEKMYV